jgi:DNA polymerase (family 10)
MKLRSKVAEERTEAVRRVLCAAGLRVDLSGGLRRGAEFLDYGVLLSTASSGAVQEALRSSKLVIELRAEWIREMGVKVVHKGLPVTIYLTTDQSWGAAQLIYTGAAPFTSTIKGHARKLGFLLNHKGLWLNQEIMAGISEEQIFQCLGLPEIPPEERGLEWKKAYNRYVRYFREVPVKESTSKP